MRDFHPKEFCLSFVWIFLASLQCFCLIQKFVYRWFSATLHGKWDGRSLHMNEPNRNVKNKSHAHFQLHTSRLWHRPYRFIFHGYRDLTSHVMAHLAGVATGIETMGRWLISRFYWTWCCYRFILTFLFVSFHFVSLRELAVDWSVNQSASVK